MASRLLASVVAARAGVAERLSALPHARSCSRSMVSLPVKSLVSAVSFTPQNHTHEYPVSIFCSAPYGFRGSLQPSRSTWDISSCRQRCTATRRISSGKRTGCGEKMCPPSCHFMQTNCCSCTCGAECSCSRKCGASMIAGFAAVIGPVDAYRSRGTGSSVVVDSRNSIACAPLLHQQQRHQSFSSAARTAREQRHAAALPTPPPIFGCTGRSSSYEAVAEAVGNDAEAAAATSTGSHKVLQVTSMDFYESCVYEKSHTRPLVCCFVTRGSLQSKLLLQPFKELAAATQSASGGHTEASTHPLFLLIDCDDVPRAAYHARVEHVPSVVVMKKDDGFREIISDPAAEKTAAEMVQETKQALERLQRQEQELPAGVQQGPSRYTKNIGVDNLNVYRVGWVAP